MRLGVVGTGMIAQYMLKIWSGIEGLSYQAICSRDMGRGRALADSYGIPRVYNDYDDLLNDDSVDTLYIALPNHLHYSYAKSALTAGKHVIVEKPFTSTDHECADLVRLSVEQGVFLWEAITTLHLPVFHKMKELLPDIGPIKLMQSSYCRVSSRYEDLRQGKFTHTFSLESSGGALMDLNIYNNVR